MVTTHEDKLHGNYQIVNSYHVVFISSYPIIFSRILRAICGKIL